MDLSFRYFRVSSPFLGASVKPKIEPIAEPTITPVKILKTLFPTFGFFIVSSKKHVPNGARPFRPQCSEDSDACLDQSREI